MKIGTDGVLLGSIAARMEASQVLDVGTGCGLLALMIAQKNPGTIVAIDQDFDAIETARYNVSRTCWKGRITVVHSRFQDFWPKQTQKFDLIVCNPPFFHNSLKNDCSKKALARHSGSLPPAELLGGASYLLAESGSLLIIVPFEQEHLWVSTAYDHSLGCAMRIEIAPRLGISPHRIILQFSRGSHGPISDSLNIELDKRNLFSKEYKLLTSDYYLNF